MSRSSTHTDTLELLYARTRSLQQAWLSYGTGDADLLPDLQGEDWTMENLLDHIQIALIGLSPLDQGLGSSQENRRNLTHEHSTLLKIGESRTLQRRRPGQSVGPSFAGPRAADSVCYVCSDNSNLIRLTCGFHFGCASCLQQNFNFNHADPTSSFPPVCCGMKLSVNLLIGYISIDKFVEFEDKVIEKSGLGRAVYCHDCSHFIRPAQVIEGQAWCWRCRLETCASCGKKSHEGPCVEDNSGEAELQQLAQAQGWQRCKVCGTTVEKSAGCNHMSCVCGSHFCYICGADWRPTRACTCPQFDVEVADPDGFVMGVDGIPRLPNANHPGLLHVPVQGELAGGALPRLIDMINRNPGAGGPLEGAIGNLPGNPWLANPGVNRPGLLQVPNQDDLEEEALLDMIIRPVPGDADGVVPRVFPADFFPMLIEMIAAEDGPDARLDVEQFLQQDALMGRFFRAHQANPGHPIIVADILDNQGNPEQPDEDDDPMNGDAAE